MMLFQSYMEPKLEDAEREIQEASFYLECEYSGTLIVHDGNLEKGQVINSRRGNTKNKVDMMAKSTSEPEIRQALAEVKHPEIASTLVDLGILKNIIIEGKKITLTLALPLMGIPLEVRDYLINSVRQALANLDETLEVDVNLAEMNPEERAKFLAMAKEGWIG